MAQFTVHRDRIRPRGPLLLDVQSDLVERLETRVVVPLLPATRSTGTINALMPILTVGGKRYVMRTPQLAGIPGAELGESVGDLSNERAAIIGALDLLFTGI